jgi:phospholipid-binding lipoprotein MlaA
MAARRNGFRHRPPAVRFLSPLGWKPGTNPASQACGRTGIVRSIAIILGVVALVPGCVPAPDPQSLDHDPFVAQNQSAHRVNVPVDRAVYRPAARGYGLLPQEIRTGVGNVRDNWRLPQQVVQYGLQARGTDAAKSATRFLVNTLLGLGGLVDIARDMGLPYDETNFDEVFYRWGVPEGGYVELPLGGPGTQRDWTGYALDQALDPTWYVLPVVATNALLGLGLLDLANTRYELDAPVTALMHESADSYNAVRISYVQNMRARLQGGTDVDQLEDVYDDF